MTTPISPRMLPRTATVQRAELVPAGPGASADVWGTVATVRCALSQKTVREQRSADRWEVVSDHILYTGPGVDIRRDDRFTLDGDSTVYRVVDVEDAAYLGHHLEVKCMREID